LNNSHQRILKSSSLGGVPTRDTIGFDDDDDDDDVKERVDDLFDFGVEIECICLANGIDDDVEVEVDE
jgi:hypothetical protein